MKYSGRSFLIAAAAALFFASRASASIPSPAPAYTFKVAGFQQGANYGLVTGFNNSAQTSFIKISSGQRSYWWDGTQTIELLPGTSDSYSVALDLDDNGTVVGERIINQTRRMAVIWKQGVPQDLGTLGGLHSEAQAINDLGVVAGWSNAANGSKRLFTWNNGFTDLGLLPHNISCCGEIEAINNVGQIIGHDPGSLLGGWLHSGGHFTLLPDLNGGFDSTPRDINDAGLIVGGSWPQQTIQLPVTWTNGEVHSLPMPPNGVRGEARAVNEQSEVGGFVISGNATSGFTVDAVLWKDNSYYLLKDLVPNPGDWQFQRVEDMNDRGQILVFAYSETMSYQRLILTPVPEPTVMLLVGFVALSLCARSRFLV